MLIPITAVDNNGPFPQFINPRHVASVRDVRESDNKWDGTTAIIDMVNGDIIQTVDSASKLFTALNTKPRNSAT